MIIDTQSILDWQLFQDSICAAWGPPGSAWCWLATAAMRDELAHVLGRSFALARPGRPEQVLAFFDRFAQILADPPPAALNCPLRCTDPDDQKFIDLALSLPGSWLVSRDRAVLKLRRRAALVAGVHIVRPDEWQPPGTA